MSQKLVRSNHLTLFSAREDLVEARKSTWHLRKSDLPAQFVMSELFLGLVPVNVLSLYVNSVPKMNTDKINKRECHRALYQCQSLHSRNKVHHKEVNMAGGGEGRL